MTHLTVLLPMTTALFVFGCSSSNNLRKFDDGDISKEISEDIAKKFEVKDAGALAPAPSPTPTVKGKSKKGTKNIKEKKITTEAPPSRRLATMPFQVGEKLQYDIRYLGLTAGTLNLEIHPEKEINGRKVYQLGAKAKTVKFFEMIYRVDDSLESFWDFDGLYSHRFAMNLDETKQSRKLIELYDHDKRKSFYWNRIDHVEKGYSEQKQEFDIKSWSQDILSALYYIRTAPLPTEPGKEFRFSVILDGKPWETVVRFQKTGQVYANSKNYDADIYQLENFENGQSKNKENTLWLSRDEHRYLLRVEAKVRVGSFAVALDRVL